MSLDRVGDLVSGVEWYAPHLRCHVEVRVAQRLDRRVDLFPVGLERVVEDDRVRCAELGEWWSLYHRQRLDERSEMQTERGERSDSRL